MLSTYNLKYLIDLTLEEGKIKLLPAFHFTLISKTEHLPFQRQENHSYSTSHITVSNRSDIFIITLLFSYIKNKSQSHFIDTSYNISIDNVYLLVMIMIITST